MKNFEVMFWNGVSLDNGIDAMAAMHAGAKVVRIVERRSITVAERVERLENLVKIESGSLNEYYSGRKPYPSPENYSGLYSYFVVQFGTLLLAAIRAGNVFEPPRHKPAPEPGKSGLWGKWQR